jgi:hypothetical protein
LFQLGQGQIHSAILTVSRVAGDIAARDRMQNCHRAGAATGKGRIKRERLETQPDLIRHRNDE